MHPAATSPWPLLVSVLAWLSGSALQLTVSHVEGSAVGAAALLAAVLGVIAGLARALLALRGTRSARGTRWLSRLSLLMACSGLACASFACTSWRAAQRLDDGLPAALEGRTLQVHGHVVGLPVRRAESTSFELLVEEAFDIGPERRPVQGVPRRLSLVWYAGWGAPTLLGAPPAALRAGEHWRLTVQLERPHGLANPHAFDLELWLFERGLGATGQVLADSHRTADVPSAAPVDRWRQSLRDEILRAVADPTSAGLLAALAVGDQAAIPRDDWATFRVTGVAHLVSISGLHVTLFAVLAAGLVRRLWRHWPPAVHFCPAPQAARWCGLFCAMAYALLAGWGVPAQRTVWMLAVVAVLGSWGRRWPWPMIWLTAGSVVLVTDPWALLQPGFWLSFVAVGVLMASQPAGGVPAHAEVSGEGALVASPCDGAAGRPSSSRRPPSTRLLRMMHGLRAAMATQRVATIGLAPLSLIFFQQVSLVGVVANALAIPVVSFVITPLALLGVAWPPLWTLAGWVISVLMAALEWLAAWPWAQWTAAAAPLWAMAAGLAGAVLLVLPLPWRLRLAALLALPPILHPIPARPQPGHFEVVAADVGQGSAVLVRTARHLLVFDAGPRFGAHSDAGERVLVPLLRALGEPVIHRLVLSHRDSDHTAGAARLAAELRVESTMGSLEDEHPLRLVGRSFEPCQAGQRWRWDGVEFEMLHPWAEDVGRKRNSNAMSCVLRVRNPQGRSLLLTGDIEAAQEHELLQRSAPGDLAADVLMLPHHGSAGSSSAAFLRAVQPGLAVAQAGHRNRFGHPSEATRQRLDREGIAWVQTSRCGAWRLNTASHAWPSAASEPGSPPQVAAARMGCWREQYRRYWHHRGD
jgi:competence protein ComEC